MQGITVSTNITIITFNYIVSCAHDSITDSFKYKVTDSMVLHVTTTILAVSLEFFLKKKNTF